MVPEDLPAQFDAPSLAGCAMGGTAHVGGSDGGLGHLQGVGAIVVTEQLHPGNTTRFNKYSCEDRHLDFSYSFLGLDVSYLVTDVSCELNEIVFDTYVSGPCDVFPSAAYMANFSD